jgi:hypothetical protein
MFRSRRRDVVFPQSEHARLAAALAAVFAASPEVTAGIAWHDRGYPAMDTDEIGAMDDDRWSQLMRAGFATSSASAVVDHVARMHIHRLVSGSGLPGLAAELAPGLAASLERSGLSEEEAAAIDRITHACDTAAFDFCFEQPGEGEAGGVRHAVDGHGGITFDPWPEGAKPVEGWILAFAADGYPQRPAPVVVPFRAEPR